MFEDSAIAEVVTPKSRGQEDTQSEKQPPYHVILLDDDAHTYQYVVAMLGELFAHSPPKAYKMAKELDTSGRVIVLTTSKERAEFKRDQIHAYGKDDLLSYCEGSMSATIEPSE